MDDDDPFVDSYEDAPQVAAPKPPPPAPRWDDSDEGENLAPAPSPPLSSSRRTKVNLRPVPAPPVPSERPVFSDTSAPSSRVTSPRSTSTTPRSPRVTVVCWSCGEVTSSAPPLACSECQEPPLSDVDVEIFSSSGDDEGPPSLPAPMSPRRSPRGASRTSAASSSIQSSPPLLRVGSAPAAPSLMGGVRGPSGKPRPTKPVPPPPASPPLSGSPSAPSPIASDSGGKEAGSSRSPRGGTPTSGRRAGKRLQVKAPNGTQTPDFCSVKRSPDGAWSGWLYKQKAQGRVNLMDGGWKPRYVVWDPSKARLYYYHYEGEQDFANFVSFDSMTAVQHVAEHCPDPSLAGCSFQVTASYTHRPYVFCAGSPEMCDEWVQDLLECVSDAARREEGGGETVDHIWASYESSKSKPDLNSPVLEVRVEEASFAAKHEYFVACYGSANQKFRTWISKPTAEPSWGCDGTFSGAQEKIRIKAFSRNHVTGAHKELAELDISVRDYPAEQVIDEWFVLKSKRSSEQVRVRLQLQRTTAFNFDSINGSRGVPTQVLPLRLDTGDIILFHNSHLASQATKMFTMSQWDHIAIVLRWTDNALKLFEATANGVGLFSLKARLEFLHGNTKMAVRRLNVVRTPEMLRALDGFIQVMRGRHYKKRFGVLVKAAVSSEKETSKDDEDLSSVFCSELVIASYQKMKIMSDKFAAKAFLPKDLADKDNFVELENDATVERKRIFSRRKNRGFE